MANATDETPGSSALPKPVVAMAAIIRVLAVALAAGALWRFLLWGEYALLWNMAWRSELQQGLGHAHREDVGRCLLCWMIAAGASATSVPLARSMAAPPSLPWASGVAFTAFRVLVLLSFGTVLVDMLAPLAELLVIYLVYGIAMVPDPTYVKWRWRQCAFGAMMLLAILPFWILAQPLAQRLTRSLRA